MRAQRRDIERTPVIRQWLTSRPVAGLRLKVLQRSARGHRTPRPPPALAESSQGLEQILPYHFCLSAIAPATSDEWTRVPGGDGDAYHLQHEGTGLKIHFEAQSRGFGIRRLRFK